MIGFFVQISSRYEKDGVEGHTPPRTIASTAAEEDLGIEDLETTKQLYFFKILVALPSPAMISSWFVPILGKIYDQVRRWLLVISRRRKL